MIAKKKFSITNADEVLAVLRQHKSVLVFADCEIKVGINLYEIIKDNPFEGIELIPAMTDIQQTDLMAARITPGLYLTNLKFTKSFGVVNCLIGGPLLINNVIFEQGLQFHHNEYRDRVEVKELIVAGEASFTSTYARGKFTITKSVLPLMKPGFKYSMFEQEVNLIHNSFPKGLDLSSCHFKQKLEIIDGQVTGLLNISHCKLGAFVLRGDFNGEDKIITNDIDLSYTVFREQVQLHNLKLDGSLLGTRVVFEKELYFDHSIISGKTRFPAVTAMGIISIDQCDFRGDLSFAHALLNKVLSITKTTYGGDLWLTGTKINDDIWIGAKLDEIEPVAFTGTLGFEVSTISANSIVRIFSLNAKPHPQGGLKMRNAIIKGVMDIRQVHLNEVSFNGTVVTGNLQDDGGLAASVTDWHSARLLKNEAKKTNNGISALTYYRREMELHAKSLRFRQTGDWLLLKLNAWSNNYGTNWLQGLGFTILSGFVCFYLFTLSAHDYKFTTPDWTGFVKYIWLPNGLDGLINANHSINGGLAGALFFLFGKLLIAYGVYQTIAAFRKYL